MRTAARCALHANGTCFAYNAARVRRALVDFRLTGEYNGAIRHSGPSSTFRQTRRRKEGVVPSPESNKPEASLKDLVKSSGFGQFLSVYGFALLMANIFVLRLYCIARCIASTLLPFL